MCQHIYKDPPLLGEVGDLVYLTKCHDSMASRGSQEKFPVFL